jgi:hypothetical protein
VIFVLMIAAELLRGVRVPRGAILGAYVAGAAILAGNVSVLHDAYLAYRNTSDVIKADLGALEIARDRITFPVRLDEGIADTAYVGVHSSVFLPAADRYGSPADFPSEIAAAPEPARVAADKVLGRSLGVVLAPAAPAEVRRAEGCRRLDAGSHVLRVPIGGVLVQASTEAGAQVSFRRYATASFPVAVAPLAPGQAGVLHIPTDRATEPWEMALSSSAGTTVCGGLSPT